MNHIVLKQAASDHVDFIHLCEELDIFLNRAIGRGRET